MLLTFQGYFEQGRIIPTAQIQVPEHKKLTITVSDEVDATMLADSQKSSVEEKDLAERQAAFDGFMKYAGRLPSDFDYKKELAEYREERYGNSARY
jgi:hypothetical protein